MARMGRPRTFDRDVAITQAMHLFWQHGYDATSLSQLKASIGGGITAPSFYAAFGSKQALFSEVMERYLNTHGRVTESLFDTTLPPKDAIERTLRRSAKMQCEPDHPKGSDHGGDQQSRDRQCHQNFHEGEACRIPPRPR